MSIRHPDHHVAALGPSRTRTVWEGLFALFTLVALAATLFGLAAWAIVQLVRTLLL